MARSSKFYHPFKVVGRVKEASTLLALQSTKQICQMLSHRRLLGGEEGPASWPSPAAALTRRGKRQAWPMQLQPNSPQFKETPREVLLALCDAAEWTDPLQAAPFSKQQKALPWHHHPCHTEPQWSFPALGKGTKAWPLQDHTCISTLLRSNPCILFLYLQSTAHVIHCDILQTLLVARLRVTAKEK